MGVSKVLYLDGNKSCNAMMLSARQQDSDFVSPDIFFYHIFSLNSRGERPLT